MQLRDSLLASLASLPGTREFHIHVLVSSPRKHSGLFPYAHPRPRVYLQDVLIVLSEQASSESPRVLVTAIEASVYNIPQTSCGILYISKVDSTGQGASPSPTSTLVHAFLNYYANPETRPIVVDTLWIQLFARAQGQYVFPNSADFPGKKPLTDVKLCAWWKRIFSEVAADTRSKLQTQREGEGSVEGKGNLVKLYYVLPGYSELEAIHSLNITSSIPVKHPSISQTWVYGHQYSQTEIPLPCPTSSSGNRHLAHCIPSFDDDPKSRFIDDIALTTDINGVKSPKKKRPRTSLRRKPDSRVVSSSSNSSSSKPESRAAHSEHQSQAADISVNDSQNEKAKLPQIQKPDHDEVSSEEEDSSSSRPHHYEGELDQVSPDEFWERMSFRQECIAGAVTGFFSMGIHTPHPHRQPTSTSSAIETTSNSPSLTPSPLAPQPGQVAPRLIRRVISSLMTGHEFSTTERAIRATGVFEDSIKGLCENIAEVPSTANPNLSSTAHLLYSHDHDQDSQSSSASVAKENSDNDHDHNNTETSNTLDVPRTPPRKRTQLPEISPNPFPEPETSLDTYNSHIYGSITVKNPPLAPKDKVPVSSVGNGSAGGNLDGKPVTVLTARKKKRKQE
ncbi:histone acetylation protein-domain-containing protein [Abortiporus biennis]|nr:histone acetylation protein-domain-containing protein [Abortiporus biennis]